MVKTNVLFSYLACSLRKKYFTKLEYLKESHAMVVNIHWQQVSVNIHVRELIFPFYCKL